MKHLDLTYILENVTTDKTFILQLLTVFEASLEEDVQQLSDAIENAEHDRIKRAAHKIKSGFRSLGMKQITTYLQELENMGFNQDAIVDIQDKFEGFKTLLPEVKADIKTYKEEQASQD